MIRNNKSKSSIIFSSCKIADINSDRDNNLTKDIIENLISKPCCYCGSTINIGIDRKNNDIGHTIENSVSCCYRCNYLKNSMPYEAWMYIVPGVKDTVEKGLFKNWRLQFPTTNMNRAKGENSGNSKLTNAQVLEIRSKYIPGIYTQEKLAKEYGVVQTTIEKIINRKQWKHI